ncbi:MAG: hypothetical protein N2Z65_03515, partial [Clostridiales bacterium]|nr:hypothetical protein [Clostridiales bacterium]
MKTVMLNYTYLTDRSIINVNRCKSRCYYIPYECEDSLQDPWQQSKKVYLLNGCWEFRFLKSIYDLEDDFCNIPYSDTIDVPSNPQIKGFDTPLYSGGRYPFPCDPPYVPYQNPAFCYRKSVEIADNDKKYYIVFEGTDSALYLYVNGVFVGFAQVSHAMNEFDITPFLRQGKNTIDVIVPKWCLGSYLEAQDKWRMSGIFRNVYILKRPYDHIEDYKIETHLLGSDKAEVRFTLSRGNSASVTFEGEAKHIKEGETAVFTLTSPRLWSAEAPNLYRMVLSTNGEYIEEQIGIREICVKEQKVLVNGKAIKFKGVNRHDFHPRTGFAVDQ